MKTKFAALLLAAVAALTLVPKPAHAGDKELAIIGGFLGGLIVGAALDDHHVDSHHDTVIVHRDYGRDHSRYDRSRGYWDHRTVRVWIPACWEVRYDYGRRVKIYIPGHYEVRRERVWVAYDRYDRHDRRGRGSRHW